jgi:aldehyde oxidoreductase
MPGHLKKMMLNINGTNRMVVFDPTEDSLADVLRRIGLTSVKIGCGTGQCGTCTVLLDGKAVRSCVLKMKSVQESSKVETVEGLGVAGNLHPLQLAWIAMGGVQCGFCSPGFIMSAKALLDQNRNPSRAEVRSWFQRHRNACRCTGYKPAVDAVMAAAAVLRGEQSMDSLLFKMPADGNLYGTNFPRPTALSKVTGACDYGADVNEKLPGGVLHLAPVFAGISHGTILEIDTSEAETMPGVKKIITSRDVAGTNRIVVPVGKARCKAIGNEQPILADQTVFRYGDVCALVAAGTRKQARAAAKAVRVRCEQLPEYLDLLDAAADNAAQIQPGLPNVYYEQPHFWGRDTAEIMQTAAHVVQDSFYTQREPHLVLEPECGMAYVDEDGSLSIHYKSQFIYLAKIAIAAGIGLDPEKIRVIDNPVGASFGYTMSPAFPALLAVAALATGAPCAMTFNYEEHQHFTGKRAPSYSNIRMAADAAGRLQAMEYEIAFDTGPYPFIVSSLLDKVPTFMGCPYAVPNVKGLAKAVFTNHAFQTAYRSYGVVQINMATEQIMDELAEQLHMDPLEFRYRNVLRPGELLANGSTMDSNPVAEMLDLLRPKYREALSRAKQASTETVKRGVGVCCSIFKAAAGANDKSEVHLELNPDGTVTQFNSWEDMGQGADVGTLIHTYEALRPLGLRPDQIRLVQNDTKTCPNSGPAAGSRSHFINGNATLDAAKKMMDAMRKPDGSFRTYEEMDAEGIPTRYAGFYSSANLSGSSSPDPNTGLGRDCVLYAYAVMLAEVAVDLTTGKVKVERFRCISDVGKLGSRQVVEGQAYSGIMHGIGTALSEDYSDIKKHATMLGAGFPYIEMIPDDMEVEFMDSYREEGPHGSSGCAESFQSGPHSAVFIAIYNACGVRIRELPATPDKILAALQNPASNAKPAAPYYLGCDWEERMEEIRETPV